MNGDSERGSLILFNDEGKPIIGLEGTHDWVEEMFARLEKRAITQAAFQRIVQPKGGDD